MVLKSESYGRLVQPEAPTKTAETMIKWHGRANALDRAAWYAFDNAVDGYTEAEDYWRKVLILIKHAPKGSRAQSDT